MPRYAVEFVADQTHLVQRPPGRVVELPVLVALALAERAGIAAASRDHDIGRLHDLVRERLGELLRDFESRASLSLKDRVAARTHDPTRVRPQIP
jgi:hypothetical protein